MRARWAVFTLHGAVATAIVITHSRTPADRLYHSRGGGLSRAGVFACFPTAVAAIALLPQARRRRLALAALPLCASVAIPGVVDERHLDMRRRNLPALAGVALTVAAGDASTAASAPAHPRLRRLLAGALLALSTPWILADLGLQTRGMAAPSPDEPGVDRVHLGHHEGLDGALLALDGVLLAPQERSTAHGLLIGLVVAYGTAVAAQDAWDEQVVKRGWARRQLPDVVRPSPTAAWAALVIMAPLVRRAVGSR